MLYNSIEFIYIFLPISLVFYYLLIKFSLHKYTNYFLIICSLYFYSYLKPEDTFIIVLSIVGNYFFTVSFTRLSPERKKISFLFALLINIAILIFYKYSAFLINDVLSLVFDTSYISLQFRPELPLAISFFTFQQIAFLVYRYRISHTKKITDSLPFNTYAASVVFFPHLIAGPLVEYKELIPQFEKKKILHRLFPLFFAGTLIFVLGLAKKMLIADQLHTISKITFDSQIYEIKLLSFHQVLLSVLSYTLQLYFDFSGYSDMAIGLAIMFGVRLPFNFNSPYKSTSLIDFWRRWHMTLSYFLRNYVYIPLGGSRTGIIRKNLNLFLTMLIGGLWHGAGWTFIIWGCWHGLGLVLNHFYRSISYPRLKTSSILSKMQMAIKTLLTFCFVAAGWIFFRSKNLDVAKTIFSHFFSTPLSSYFDFQFYKFFFENFLYETLSTIICLIIVWIAPNSNTISRHIKIIVHKFYKQSWTLKKHYALYLLLILSSLILVICTFKMRTTQTFIYYQF